MRVILVRHGTTRGQDLNDPNVHDDPLGSGIDEARLCGDALAHVPLDAVFVSPLTRAMETALQIMKHHTCPAIPTCQLREYGPGQKATESLRARHTGSALALLKQRFPQPFWDWNHPYAPQSDSWFEPHGSIFPPDDEDGCDRQIEPAPTHRDPSVDERLQAFLYELLTKTSHRQIAIVAHENVGRLLTGLTGIANANPLTFVLRPPGARIGNWVGSTSPPLLLLQETLVNQMAMGSSPRAPDAQSLADHPALGEWPPDSVGPARCIAVLGSSNRQTQSRRLEAGAELLMKLTETGTEEGAFAGAGSVPIPPEQKYARGNRAGVAAVLIFSGSRSEWTSARDELTQLLPPSLRGRVLFDWRSRDTLDNTRRIALMLAALAPYRNWVVSIVTNDWHTPRSLLAGLSATRELQIDWLRWTAYPVQTTLIQVAAYPSQKRERWWIDGAITARRAGTSNVDDWKAVVQYRKADFVAINFMARMSFAAHAGKGSCMEPAALARRQQLRDLILGGDDNLTDVANLVWDATMRPPTHAILHEVCENELPLHLAARVGAVGIGRVMVLCWGCSFAEGKTARDLVPPEQLDEWELFIAH